MDIPSCHMLSNAKDRGCGLSNGAEVVGECNHRPSDIDSTEVGILGVGEDTRWSQIGLEALY